MDAKKVALIPSYQPEDILVSLVKSLSEKNYDVVVVDDGSGPSYYSLFEKTKLYGHLISYAKNQGKGHALKKGLKYIQDNYEDAVVVTLDGDGQHDIDDAEKIVSRASQDKELFVTGARYLDKDAPTKSKMGNAITRWVYKTITGLNVHDTQTGLRAFSSKWIPAMLEIKGERYEYEMNVLLYIAKNKLKIEEIPIKVIYFDKENSVSHFDAVKDSIKIYKEIFKFAGSSFASFLVDYSLYAVIVTILGATTAGLMGANLLARAVSSIFNFTLNKKFVFKSKGNLFSESVKYFALVLFNICINTAILTLLAKLGVNVYVGKIIVELSMFAFSYVMQHFLVFGKDGKERLWPKKISIQ